MNWVFVSQKTAFFIVTAVKTSNLKSSRITYEVVGRRGGKPGSACHCQHLSQQFINRYEK
jgi:hypothetical protein